MREVGRIMRFRPGIVQGLRSRALVGPWELWATQKCFVYRKSSSHIRCCRGLKEQRSAAGTAPCLSVDLP